MKVKAHRIGKALSIGLVGAALLTGGAQAADRPDDRAGLLGVGAVAATQSSPDVFEREVARQTAANVVPDVFERAVLRGITAPVRPDDRAGARGPGIVSVTPTATVSTVETGFQWGDAVFGAAAMLGAVLLAAAATLTIRHRGRVIMP